MNTEARTLAAELLDIICRLVDLPIEEKVKPLESEPRLLKSLLSEWLDTQ
jgi:hypothetical protein